MMRRRAIVLAGLTLGCAGAIALACSSGDTTGDLPPPFDAAPGDGRADTSTPVIVDAAVVIDAPSGPFCTLVDASSLILCDDFESTSAPLFGFEQSTLTGTDGGSVLSISDEGGVTNPTRILDLRLTQKADAGQSAFLTKNLPDSGAPDSFLHYEVELDFRVEGTASLAYVALAGLQFPGGGIKEHGLAVYDGNVFGRLVPKDFAVKDDKSLWHHARIVLDRPKGSSASSFATTIAIDGTLIDNVGGVDPGVTGGSKLRIGGFSTSPAAAGALHAQFDNVVIRRW